MKHVLLVLLGAGVLVPLPCLAQQAAPDAADAAAPAPSESSYSMPTQSERLRNYLRHTYSVATVLEAAARGGIDEARDRPSEWPRDGQGYVERFGSAFGMITVRATTEYVVGAALTEDLRIKRCRGCSVNEKFKAAFRDTFTARTGEDGHTTFSVARLIGPISGTLVASNTWYPSSGRRAETAKGLAITYGMVFTRNLVKELIVR